MDLIVAWILFPAVLTALALGWGLVVEAISGRALPRPLLPGIGLAGLIVAGSFCTVADLTAELTVPVVALVALAGLVHGRGRLLGTRPDGWAIAVSLAVFAIYSAPIVLSGQATFAGYIKLDDTATWLALTDHVLEHGRNLEGLAPSTYEATLRFNLADGYPVGAFIPFGVAAKLVATDGAWLIQPYMAWVAATMSLALFWLAGALVDSRPARALAAFVAAQPALLFGYYLWGGIKEVVAACLVTLTAALAADSVERPIDFRRLLPLAIACGAMLAVLTAGGAIWFLPILAAALAISVSRFGWSGSLRPAMYFAATVLLLSLPLVLGDALLPPTSSPLNSETAQGNLFHPLSYLQAAGIWPVGDFRVTPDLPFLTYAACTILIACAAYSVWRAWGRGWRLVLYGAAAVVAVIALILIGSPWVEGKGMATASPAFALLGIVGAVMLLRDGRTWLGGTAMTVIVLGVLASGVFAYHEVILAPRDQLAELETIGADIEGEGPTLITEYQPYAARHFLRDSAPEALSELRRRVIPLTTGEQVQRGRTADTDQIDLASLLAYRTLVLRRSPAQSRPPSPYRLVWHGTYYEVWQRPEGTEGTVRIHLPLGSPENTVPVSVRTSKVGIPDCSEVLGLAASAGPGDRLVVATGLEPLVLPADPGSYPESWHRASDPRDSLYLEDGGTWTTRSRIPAESRYGLWLGGSIRGRIRAWIDGKRTAEISHHLNNFGEYIPLGSAELDAGEHEVRLEYSGHRLTPGTYGRNLPAGPLVLGQTPETSSLRIIAPGRARSLCGRSWDWIELVGPS